MFGVSIIIPTCKTQDQINKQKLEILNTAVFNKNVVFTCQPASAAANRNLGLRMTQGHIVIMLDDDITGFFPGWDEVLLKPMFDHPEFGVVSARLTDGLGRNAHMMGDPGDDQTPVVDCIDNKVCTACIAFRRSTIMFDENFIGSGFEDDDFMRQMRAKFPNDRIVINNRCRLI